MNYSIIPNDPVAQKKILDGFKEISASFHRIEGEKTYIRESIKMLSEEYEIPKPILNKLARIFHRQEAKDVKETTDILLAAYEKLTGEQLED